jgi:hypothetical protein
LWRHDASTLTIKIDLDGLRSVKIDLLRVATDSILKFPPHICEQGSEVRREKMESSERGPDVVRRFCALS